MDEERLRKIEVAQAEVLTLLRALAEKMDDRSAVADSWRKRIDRILMGDGNGAKGHNVRLDRLEQAHDRQKWLIRSLLIPVVLLALKAVAGLLGPF